MSEKSESNDSKSADVKPGAATDVLERLKTMEAALAESVAENKRLREEAEAAVANAGLRYQPNAKAFAGPEGYEFEVVPVLKDGDNEYRHLKRARVKAVDEGEAKRWYCQANEGKPGTGTALDPMKVRLEVRSLSPQRATSIVRQKQISALRAKVNSGMQLSKSDTVLLNEVESEIYGY